jgi:uncharacterized protein YceK
MLKTVAIVVCMLSVGCAQYISRGAAQNRMNDTLPGAACRKSLDELWGIFLEQFCV